MIAPWTPSPPPSPPASRARPAAPRDPEGTRARILAAARDESARHGLGGARVDRIAEAAGTNKRMLYYHAGNKEELYLAVLACFYLSNMHTLSAIFGRDLLAESAKGERLAHMTELVLASLRR